MEVCPQEILYKVLDSEQFDDGSRWTTTKNPSWEPWCTHCRAFGDQSNYGPHHTSLRVVGPMGRGYNVCAVVSSLLTNENRQTEKGRCFVAYPNPWKGMAVDHHRFGFRLTRIQRQDRHCCVHGSTDKDEPPRTMCKRGDCRSVCLAIRGQCVSVVWNAQGDHLWSGSQCYQQFWGGIVFHPRNGSLVQYCLSLICNPYYLWWCMCGVLWDTYCFRVHTFNCTLGIVSLLFFVVIVPSVGGWIHIPICTFIIIVIWL